MTAATDLKLHLEARKHDLPARADAVYTVQVDDPQAPDVEPVFEYWLLAGWLLLGRVEVKRKDDTADGIEISPTYLRTGARWGAWEAATRIRVEEFVEDVGEELHPAEGASPSELLRSGKGRVDWDGRLTALALEYRLLVKQGVRNPVEELASRVEVPTETVRAWVHRARKEGYLPPWKDRPA